jgi:hypothetical protein
MRQINSGIFKTIRQSNTLADAQNVFNLHESEFGYGAFVLVFRRDRGGKSLRIAL